MGTPPWSCDEIGDGHRLVAVWAGPTWTNTFAKPPAVRAALLAEIAHVALRAYVHGGQPRYSHRESRDLELRVTSSPGCLPTHPVTEALSTHRIELRAAHGTAHRLGIVTQRLHLDLADGCAGAAPACVGSGTTRSPCR